MSDQEEESDLDSMGDEPRSPMVHITDEELRRHVVWNRRAFTKIMTVLRGDDLGTVGIIPRQNQQERDINELKQWRIVMTAKIVAYSVVSGGAMSILMWAISLWVEVKR